MILLLYVFVSCICYVLRLTMNLTIHDTVRFVIQKIGLSIHDLNLDSTTMLKIHISELYLPLIDIINGQTNLTIINKQQDH